LEVHFLVRYTEEFKLKIIKALKESKESKADISEEYRIPKQTIHQWEKAYDLYGAEGLVNKVENKNYPGSFKQEVVEDMRKNHLSQSETSLKYHVGRTQIQTWERKYLEEGPEGLYIERRGRKGTGRSRKRLNKKVEEDLIAENQRLRMENEYLKKLNALVRQKKISNPKTKLK
jgi:transposase